MGASSASALLALVALLAAPPPARPTARFYRGSAAMVSNPERGFRHEIDGGCTAQGISDAVLAELGSFNLTVAQTYCCEPIPPHPHRQSR